VLATRLKGAGVEGLQPEVAVALRMGCHQLLGMRVPDHAAVGTSVELVRASVGERPVRLVNAVLRAVSRRQLGDWMAEVAPDASADPVGKLAVAQAHPRWIVEEFQRRLGGLDEVGQLLAVDNEAPSVSLVVRPGLATVAELVEPVEASPAVEPGRWSPYAAKLTGGGDPGAVGAVRQGRAGVQDEGSQLAAMVLARASVDGRDARWLDLCAGPGGKSALLTGLAREHGAALVAVERQPHRARLVRSALRAYPGSAPIVVTDGTRPPFREATFDRVLVDAPCTGLGALRRRPESRWRRRPTDLDSLVPLQEALLSSALRLARPGGVVAYVTCSPVQAETRGVVASVMRRGGVHEEDAAALLPEVPNAADGLAVQLWPHRHGTDAMFVALLRRE
jgi:16S rRNA (cytosine967-C5)-methyltransferase